MNFLIIILSKHSINIFYILANYNNLKPDLRCSLYLLGIIIISLPIINWIYSPYR